MNTNISRIEITETLTDTSFRTNAFSFIFKNCLLVCDCIWIKMQIVNFITDLKNKYFLLKFNNPVLDDVSCVRNTGIVKIIITIKWAIIIFRKLIQTDKAIKRISSSFFLGIKEKKFIQSFRYNPSVLRNIKDAISSFYL